MVKDNFSRFLRNVTSCQSFAETEVIQSLWSGYGKISRYQLIGAKLDSVVVKHISPGIASSHPRGWNTNTSHQRKLKSYSVESNWYESWSGQCPAASKIPQFIGRHQEGEEIWIVMEDLDIEFPLRKSAISLSEVRLCLSWLAQFHAAFMGKSPIGLWDVGTYWHLETRPDEWKQMHDLELKKRASSIDHLLNSAKFKTIVHGDAKLANFCFSANGKMVAAVDFQYVGGGCGMKDVAYFLGSCLSSEECAQYEQELLDHYFKALHKALAGSHDDANAIESEWRKLFAVAWTDFTRFLLGWMPTHQKLNDYSLRLKNQVLASL